MKSTLILHGYNPVSFNVVFHSEMSDYGSKIGCELLFMLTLNTETVKMIMKHVLTLPMQRRFIICIDGLILVFVFIVCSVFNVSYVCFLKDHCNTWR